MKPVLTTCILAAQVLALSACNKSPTEDAQVQIANPASEYCAKLGGKSEVKKDESGGQYRMCNLPDGTSIEEWELFRRDNKEQK